MNDGLCTICRTHRSLLDLASNLVQTAHFRVSTSDGSCTIPSYSIATDSLLLFIFSLPLLESSNWNLPPFLYVSHGRIAWICTLLSRFVATLRASQLLKIILLPRGSYCHARLLTTPLINHTCWKAGHCVSSLVELSAFGEFGQ